MDTGAVLRSASSHGRDGFQKAASSCNLDTPAVEGTSLEASGQASNGRSQTQESGCRNYERIVLEWRNLTFEVKSGKVKKTLVTNVSGAARPGTLTAIMGPSGAGKTTLLNLLSGLYEKGYKGEVQINGYVRDQSLFNKQSCYVMQQDRLLPALTIHEALTMSVGLRMTTAPDLVKSQMASSVDQLVEEWGLGECRHTRTERLSGGERKRLAIAQELVDNPPVVFLDEPTTGLDNCSSLMCVEILKRLAERGHTVICSLHTPSAKIFANFDMLYMMSHGRCIYNGETSNLVSFLSEHGLPCPEFHNPADFITEVAAGEYGQHAEILAGKFALPLPITSSVVVTESETAYGGHQMTKQEKAEAVKRHSFQVNQFRQFRILLKRCWLSAVRNRVTFLIRFVAYVAFALMAVITFYGVGKNASTVFNNSALFFTIGLTSTMQTILPAVIIFPMEMGVLLRENRNGWYSVNLYYLANYVNEIPFLIAPFAIYLAILYYPTGQPLELWRAATMLLFGIQLGDAMCALGLMVSAVAQAQTAVFAATALASPFVFFNSFFIPDHLLSSWLRWIPKVSPVHYTYHGMLLSAFGYGRAQLECDKDLCLFENPEDYLQVTGTSGMTIHGTFLSLLAIEVVFRLIVFVILRLRVSRKR
ncbi:unnamed protein product [Ixodes hexagonus]